MKDLDSIFESSDTVSKEVRVDNLRLLTFEGCRPMNRSEPMRNGGVRLQSLGLTGPEPFSHSIAVTIAISGPGDDGAEIAAAK